jgi:hypothetical protein
MEGEGAVEKVGPEVPAAKEERLVTKTGGACDAVDGGIRQR